MTSHSRHLNPASLLPNATHNPALLALTTKRIDNNMVAYIARRFVDALPLECENVDAPKGIHKALPLEEFMIWVINKARTIVNTSQLLTTLIYLDRIANSLPSISDDPYARHKLFLGTHMVSHKYLCDTPYSLDHWVGFTADLISFREAFAAERKVLGWLNYDLRFSEVECLRVWKPLILEMEKWNRTLLVPRTPVLSPLRTTAYAANTTLNVLLGHRKWRQPKWPKAEPVIPSIACVTYAIVPVIAV